MSASMGVVCDDSSSESENEEEVERLREATCVQVPSPSTRLAAKCSAINKTSGKYKKLTGNKPSLRYAQKSQDESFNSNLHVTAEVKAFIAKKLSQSLDSSIELSGESGLPEPCKMGCVQESSNDDSGFRMFSNKTQGQLDAKREAKRLKLQQARRLKRKNSSSDSSEEEARLAEAAVSPEFILQNNSMISVQNEQDQRSKPNAVYKDDCDVLVSKKAEDSMESGCSRNKTYQKNFKKKKLEKTEMAKHSSSEEGEAGTSERLTENTNEVKKKKKKKRK